MKNKKLISVVFAILLMVTMCLSLTGCGAKSVGLYSQQYLHNHTDMKDPVSYAYKLEVFKDGTYIMNYETMWAIPVVTLTYGRDITAYGKYEVKSESPEEGTITYTLSMPTRLSFIHEERSSVSCVVDTARWPEGNAAEEIAPGFTYTLNARAETEVWENAADFIAAYGRSYEVVCDTTKGTMKVTVISHDGVQIPGDAAVKPVEVAAK